MLIPSAFTEGVKYNYSEFRKSCRGSSPVYAHDEVLFIKSASGFGKTAGALAYCARHEEALYFSFRNLDATLAPRLFAAKYPEIFRPCSTWEAFFDQLQDLGTKRSGIVFFDDAGMRNDKGEFVDALQKLLARNKRFKLFIIFLMRPWEALPLKAKERYLKPMSPAEIRRALGLRDEDTFRLYTVTSGIPYLVSQYDSSCTFEENMRMWLRLSSPFYDYCQRCLSYCFRSPESYNTLLYGMATGQNRVIELSALSGFPQNKVDKYLKALEDRDLAIREKEPGNYTRYTPANNYFLLWYKYLFAGQTTGDGAFSEATVAAFMDDLDNALVPATFRKLVLCWVDHHQGRYLRSHIDIRTPYLRDVTAKGIHFDLVFKTNERESRYIVLKLFDHLEDRCGKDAWRAIDAAAPAIVPYYFSTLILASIHRFSDACWQETTPLGNIKLVQVQTLTEVDFAGSWPAVKERRVSL